MRSTLHIILNSPIQPLRVILVRQRSTHNWLPSLRCKTGWFRRSLVTAAIRFYNADRSFYCDDLHFLLVHFIPFNYCWCFMFSLYLFYVLTLSIGHLNFPEGINKIYLSVCLSACLTGYRQSGFKPYRDELNNHLFKFGYRGIYLTLLITQLKRH